jgi:DNA polymerase II small subunit
MTNKEILKICMQKGFLLDKELLNLLFSLEENLAKKLINSFILLNISERVITKELFIENYEKIMASIEGEGDFPLIKNFFLSLGVLEKDFSFEDSKTKKPIKEPVGDSVKILFSPIIVPKKISVQDFVGHFRSRYESLKSILLDKNLENLKSLRRIGKDRENYHVIVCVFNKRITKNGNILLEVEDLNGTATVLINSNKKELFLKAKDVLLDEVIALGVSGNNEILFANDIIYPDVAISERKKCKKEEIAAFISDIHVGSTMFFEENFLRFIRWLNGEEGDEDQKNLAKKVKYLFINGDLVDGVGHFPGQDVWLNILDMEGQYNKVIELLSLVRKDVQIIISPGNHDAVWVGEPQPIIDEKWAKGLHELENVKLVTNPAVVEIQGCIKILMYHGASMHGMINDIESLRMVYKTDSPPKIVNEMLKRRHLAPTHGLVDYIPQEKGDMLLIKQVPDIITTADLHKSEVGNYNGVLIVSTSCWQAKTPFQEKVGNNPDFCKVPLFNLKTREVKILDFFSK